MKLALVALVAACGGEVPAPAAVSTGFRVDAPELIVGVIDGWSSTTVSLRRWHRAGESWRPVGDAWPGSIGNTGAAWGDGLHGHGAPPGRDGPLKREGDRAAPAGVFAVRAAYGYAAAARSQLVYHALTPSWECVDDPASSHYTQLLDRATVGAPDWTSSEKLRRADAIYTWIIDIAHNPGATPRAGSCIFFHVWAAPGTATIGCTAMDEGKLASLITDLDARADYVLLPRAEYAALAKPWGLPPL